MNMFVCSRSYLLIGVLRSRGVPRPLPIWSTAASTAVQSGGSPPLPPLPAVGASMLPSSSSLSLSLSSPSLSSLLPFSSSLSLSLSSPSLSFLLPSLLLPSVHFSSSLQQMFGDTRTTVVTSKHALQFLLKCLTEAVPHEPPFALRVGVHSSSPPPFTLLSVFLFSFLLVLLLTLFSLPQAHIESPPRRMARCHVLLSDYISLAKTRLRELNVCTAVCGQ